MSSDLFKKGYAIVTIAQLVFSFVALFASSFIWNDSNVYIQLGYKGFGWQTLIFACLLFIWIINAISFLAQVGGKNLFQEYGKFRLLIVYGICGLLALIIAALETWNTKLAAQTSNKILHPRFIIAAVFCWLLVISHILMIIITLFI